MNDISKCCGSNCDKKENCWRYKAPSQVYQVYISAEYCIRFDHELYWPMGEKNTLANDTGKDDEL